MDRDIMQRRSGIMSEKTRNDLLREIDDLKWRLHEAQENLDAIRQGEIDAIVVSGEKGEQVFTLKEADRPYRIIIEEMSEGAVTVSEEGVILYCNRQLASMLGVPLERLMGKSLCDYVSPASRSELTKLISEDRGRTGRAEIVLRRAGGEEIHTLVSFSPFRIDDIPAFLGVVTDVSSEKKAQERVKETNELLERMFANTHVLTVYLDREFNFIRVNRAFCMVCGRAEEFFEGKNFFSLYPDPAIRRIFRRAVETGEPFSANEKLFSCCLDRPQDMYWDWNLQPVKGQTGEVEGLILTLVDRTAHKALEKERQRLVKAVEHAGDVVIITDSEGTVQYVNSAVERITGFKPRELVGKPLGFIRPNGDGARNIHRTLAAGGVWKGRRTGQRKDGERIEFESTVSPVYGESGKVLNYVVIEHDMTHEALLEQQVRQMQKIEALGRLAGGIAHDLNNILYPIIINTEMLLNDTRPDSPEYEPLKQVLHAAYRQRDLVKQVLAFSRRNEQQHRPVAVTPLVREALQFLKVSLPSTIDIQERLHAACDTVMGDPAQIHQVIMNLSTNAAEAIGSKPGTIEVTLANTRLDDKRVLPGMRVGQYLQLTVRDTGGGMTEEEVERAFEPFFSTKDTSKSSGMGLAVVHGIVKSHGGTITVESKKNKGSRFTVYMPVAGKGEERMQTSDRDGPGKSGDKKQRVLLVDDENLVLMSVQRALERLGYEVDAVKDGPDALEIFCEDPDSFDVVITDQTMPKMTGAELAEEILHIRPDIPVILSTGFSETISEQEARAMGVRDLLMKPATTKDLDAVIRRATGRQA
jgi:PAS domain S-box-containing protein